MPSSVRHETKISRDRTGPDRTEQSQKDKLQGLLRGHNYHSNSNSFAPFRLPGEGDKALAVINYSFWGIHAHAVPVLSNTPRMDLLNGVFS